MTSHTAVGQENRGACVPRGALSLVVLGGVLALLSGCASQPEQAGGRVAGGEDGVIPRAEPRSRYGNPASYVVRGRTYYTKDDSRGHVERGVASWYGPGFHGRRTSSGEPYDMNAMTAAHKTLPLPTYARVTNLENGRSAVVRINDRGPFHGPRVIDLSRAAAAKLGVLATGTAEVEVRALDPASPGSIPPNPFLLAANTPKTQPQVQAAASPQPFLEGFETSRPPAPGVSPTPGDRSRGMGPAVAAATGPAAPVRSDPAQAKPDHRPEVSPEPRAAREVARSQDRSPEIQAPGVRSQEPAGRELVVAQRAGAVPKTASAGARPQVARTKAQAEPKLAVAGAKDGKGGAQDRGDAVAAKAEGVKGRAEPGTKVAKLDPPAGGMYLQVGAFGDRSNAENLRKRLSKELAKHQVQVRSISADSSALYKVQVGPLASRAKASDLSQQLAVLGVTKSHVVVE